MSVHLVEGEEEFDHVIQNTHRKYLVVDFYADWCGPCLRFAPTFKQLSAEYPHIKFLKVNIDDSEDVAQNLDITSLPTFMFFQSGKLVPIKEPIIGINKDALVDTLDELSANIKKSNAKVEKKSSKPSLRSRSDSKIKKTHSGPIDVHHDIAGNLDVEANTEES